jgi:cytidine deaminase
MKQVSPEALIEQAVTAAQHAHCPYSDFHVGAALLTQEGQIFTGANVENASYGMTICAERTAFGSAITAGVRTFQAIAIVAETLPYPCGACRQVIAEFCNDDFTVLLATLKDPHIIQSYTIGELLPHSFSLKPNP